MQGLEHERFMSVQTFRRSGEAVATPVWFALHGGGFVFGTHRDSGKVRRIRSNPSVRYAAANYRGLERAEYRHGSARLLDEDEAIVAERALADKYGWQWNPFSRLIDCYVGVEFSDPGG
ncbi:MAG TPA: PPOX class F420-dependent oxidoreductase [Acidimicrobiia bacterium]|nr:PPOX class F420-dependent oxidoreductase [Acidimicrobiia bacterium]